jgi:hypothetical protein
LQVDWSVRCEILENEKITFSSCDVTLSKPSLSYGTSGQVETPNGAKRQEAHRTPRGKRAAWSGNQLLSKVTMYAKKMLQLKEMNKLRLINHKL